MSQPALAPRGTLTSMISVWVIAVLATIAVGLFVPTEARGLGLILAFGGVVVLAFAVQLFWVGRVQGFIVRTAGTVTGALVLMGVVSAGLVLSAFVTG